MSIFLRFRKHLEGPPSPSTVADMTIRTFAGDADVGSWLELRRRSFADRVAAGRDWTAADFEREFQSKAWWSPERMWFAVAPQENHVQAVGGLVSAEPICGTITLGRSGRSPHDFASVSWLMIAPEHRRRGIARALLTALEARAWADGERRLSLETHAAWTDAVGFYEACGYRRCSE